MQALSGEKAPIIPIFLAITAYIPLYQHQISYS